MRERVAGFSLLEVLVALAVLGISLGVLFRVFGQSLTDVGRAEHYTQAVLVAESQLALIGADPGNALRSYETDVDDRFHVSVDVSPMAPRSGGVVVPLSAYRVSVTVGWGEGSRRRQVTATTVRLGQPG